MIVTPEGLNVFPEDVERVLNADSGRARFGGRRRRDGTAKSACTRCSSSIRASARTTSCGSANAQLDDHQRIRGARVWPGAELPRTEGTRKLKRREIREWVQTGARRRACRAGHGAASKPSSSASCGGPRASRRAPRSRSSGLSSLERVELMVALEDAFKTRIDEAAFAGARRGGPAAACRSAPAIGRACRRAGRLSARGIAAWPVRAMRGGQSVGVPAAARARVRVDPRRGARAPARSARPGDLRVESSEPHGRAGDSGGAAAARARGAWRRRWRRNSSRRTSFPSSSRGRSGSPTASTTSSRRCSSMRFRCRSAKPARGRRCATSASCSSDGFSVSDLSRRQADRAR